MILLKGSKKCPFLGKKGCTIFDSRPMECRIYPLWFKEMDIGIKILVEWERTRNNEICLIMRENYKQHEKKILNKMKENKKSMTETVKKFIKEIRLHEEIKEQLNKKSIMEVLNENGLL